MATSSKEYLTRETWDRVVLHARPDHDSLVEALYRGTKYEVAWLWNITARIILFHARRYLPCPYKTPDRRFG